MSPQPYRIGPKLHRGRPWLAAFGCLSLLLTGSPGCTTVETVSEYTGGPLPKPERILVYDFAVSPDEVQIDTSLAGNLQGRAQETPVSEEQSQTARRVAEDAARTLVGEIQSFGLPAERASRGTPAEGNVLMIEGQFLAVDEGNRTERVVIGLGAGRSDVKARTEVYDWTPQGRRVVVAYETDAKPMRNIGMAESMGVGGITGNVGMAAIASGAGNVANEALGATVESDAKRMAKELAEHLGQFFVTQGWISPEAVPPSEIL